LWVQIINLIPIDGIIGIEKCFIGKYMTFIGFVIYFCHSGGIFLAHNGALK
jgi:hypothetical protein